MIVKVRCTHCGHEATVRLKKIEDALELICKECANEVQSGTASRPIHRKES